MFGWGSHRARQAGKYAKKSYEFQRAESRQASTQEYFNRGWFDFYGVMDNPHYVVDPPQTGQAYTDYRRGWVSAKTRYAFDQKRQSRQLKSA